MGVRWRVIAAMLPGRSDDAVRNRWNRLQESMRETAARGEGLSGLYDKPKTGYKCSKCGLPKRNHVCTFRNILGEGDDADRLRGKGPAGAVSHGKRRSEAADDSKLRVSWTKHEDETIRMCVRRVGPRWSLIAGELPGRTEHAVRNRWHRLQNLSADMDHAGVIELGDDDGRGHDPDEPGYFGLGSEPARIHDARALPLGTGTLLRGGPMA